MAQLRAATRDWHDRVDRAFGAFDLSFADSYARFLEAQSGAVAGAEVSLAGCAALGSWRPRADLLRADLAGMGREPPAAQAMAPMEGEAAAWGVLYVLEGSRLGGKVLSARVAPQFPRAFLGAGHLRGEWRALLAQIEAQGELGGAEWTANLIAGARACFDHLCAAGQSGIPEESPLVP